MDFNFFWNLFHDNINIKSRFIFIFLKIIIKVLIIINVLDYTRTNYLYFMVEIIFLERIMNVTEVKFDYSFSIKQYLLPVKLT